MAEPALYFAYGSNMSTARLAARVEGVRALGAGRLHHHDLVFDKPGRDGTGKANVRRASSAVVHGVVWQIEPSALDVLDRFEPGYGRTLLEVRMRAHAPLQAWTYVYSGPIERRAPSADYLGHLIRGALEHGLPDELIRRLREVSGRNA